MAIVFSLLATPMTLRSHWRTKKKSPAMAGKDGKEVGERSPALGEVLGKSRLFGIEILVPFGEVP